MHEIFYKESYEKKLSDFIRISLCYFSHLCTFTLCDIYLIASCNLIYTLEIFFLPFVFHRIAFDVNFIRYMTIGCSRTFIESWVCNKIIILNGIIIKTHVGDELKGIRDTVMFRHIMKTQPKNSRLYSDDMIKIYVYNFFNHHCYNNAFQRCWHKATNVKQNFLH